MKATIRFLLALFVCGLFFVGCDRNSGKTLKLAFVTNNASDFWNIAAAGVHKYEKESGIQVDIKMPPNGTVQEQNQILENLVTQGYDGIAISPKAPKDQVAELNKAAAKTILICHDSDAANSNRKLYIGTNNFEAGKALGMEIAKLLPKGGKMAVFVGTLSADNAAERLRGHAPVHGAGALSRSGRCPQRRLRPGDQPLRVADTAAGL